MLSHSFSLLLCTTLFLLQLVASTPIISISDRHARKREIFARTPSAPHFVVYSDLYSNTPSGLPAVSDLKGFNVLALSFLLRSGPVDMAKAWANMKDADRNALKAQYKAAGIKVVVTAFGDSDTPTTHKADPVKTANDMAAWVHQYHLDGIDIDYEDFDAINAGNGKAEAWLIAFTKQLRVQLPQPTYILTHAPVAPWFSPNKFGGGAYRTVHQNVGSLIDWYNVQFYNQGSGEYTTCNGLLTKSSNNWPKSSLFEIAAFGVPLNKLVIGKPAKPSDAVGGGFGYVSPSALAGCLATAKQKGWIAGVSVWQFPNAAAPWIKSVRSKAFPE
ncbi:glycoside hydrolase family 18 protein [Rickenella mellea]|uniref:Glycoside hydrolase family 18 protein n=1 Tax=Rickenella mellea TaxID=50990 RepID=A0A4Y7PXS3_9AGAM|nr:glycoside hydrolase family 18 protein [Rickenella mellea]